MRAVDGVRDSRRYIYLHCRTPLCPLFHSDFRDYTGPLYFLYVLRSGTNHERFLQRPGFDAEQLDFWARSLK